MKLTLAIKLAPSDPQRAALLATVERFNAACDHIARVAFAERTANKIRLQPLVYLPVRAQFGLSAQMTIRAISKVAEAYKRDRTVRPRFHPRGAMPYDQRIMSWKGLDRVSLLTLSGRELIPVRLGAYQTARRDRIRGQADLVWRRGSFALSCTVDAPEAPVRAVEDYLGLDLGIVNLAVDSDGRTYTGAAVERRRRIHAHRRRNLQRKGTKASRRKLRQIGGRQRRYQADTNHGIAKRVVAVAQGTGRGLALEDLQGLRARVSVRRRQRARHHNWSVGQLRAFLEYKAAQAGVAVVRVDPRNTSRTCPACGGVDRRNRPSQAEFRCIACGLAGPADAVAARNIASRARAAVMQPMVSDAA